MIRALPEVFRTARLLAQRIDERHLADLERLHADPAVAAWIDDPATGDGLHEWLISSVAPHWHEHGFGLFALYEKHARTGAAAAADGAAEQAGAAEQVGAAEQAGAAWPFVGRAGLLVAAPDVAETLTEKRVVELDLAVTPDARGHGYATEICGALTGLALTSLDRESVVALVRPGDDGARHVLEKLGYALEREVERGDAPRLLFRRRR